MRKVSVRFYTIADWEEEEAWLRRRHQAGWKLVRVILPCFYVFESCEPEDVIYRLDYRANEQTPAYMQMMRDFGWEYCGICVGWLYFRKPAAEAQTEEEGELLSDNASRVERVSKIVKTRLLPVTGIFLCCVIPNFLKYTSGQVHSSGWLFFAIFFSVMFVIYVFLILYCGLKLRRIRKRYQE